MLILNPLFNSGFLFFLEFVGFCCLSLRKKYNVIERPRRMRARIGCLYKTAFLYKQHRAGSDRKRKVGAI